MATASSSISQAERGSTESYKEAGYNRLATIFSKDDSIAIYRRFDKANMLILMSLQAEINCTLTELRIETQLDEKTTFSTNFEDLRNSNGEQYKKLMSLKALMKEYNELLLNVKALSNTCSPSNGQLKVLKKWLDNEKGGNGFMGGSEFSIYEEEETRPYVHVGHDLPENDPFTKWIMSHAVRVFHNLIGHHREIGTLVDPETRLTSYDSDKIILGSNILAATISSTLPVLTILALYAVKNTWIRIGMTIAFTASFAFVLAAFTTARRVEIFAATATFAAVEVVFIGSSLDAK